MSKQIVFEGVLLGCGTQGRELKVRASWARGAAQSPLEIEFKVAIRNHDVEVVIPFEPQTWSELLAVRNLARRIVQADVDISGCVHGFAGTVIFTQVRFSSGETKPLDTCIDASPLDEASSKAIEQASMASDVKADYIRHALADLRRAILESDDTAGFCVRAMDALRQVFEDDAHVNRNSQWNALWSALRAERDKTIEDLGAAQRHADRKEFVDGDRRIKMIKWTRELIRRCAIYVVHGPLDEASFEILKGISGRDVDTKTVA